MGIADADPAITSFNSMIDGQPPAGSGLQILAGISASLGSIATAMARQEAKEQKMAQAVRQVTIGPGSILITAGAGTLVQDPGFGPNTGYAQSVRRLTIWGFSAGTVAVYLNNLYGEPLPFFTSAGTYTFGRGDLLLQPQDNLVFSASGITLATGQGAVSVTGTVDNVELWALADYLL
jgi:hypothetical protein